MSGMGLSFSELCGLFCCPPWPSRIAAKLAFSPPDPTYDVTAATATSNAVGEGSSNGGEGSGGGSAEDKYRLTLHDKAEWQYSEREKDNLEVSFTRTSRGNRIATLFVRCSPNARYTVLHSHGNAVDLGQMSSFYMGLGEEQRFSLANSQKKKRKKEK